MPETETATRNPDDPLPKTVDNSSGDIHDECKSLKIADKDDEDEDPNRHLAKVSIQRVCCGSIWKER